MKGRRPVLAVCVLLICGAAVSSVHGQVVRPPMGGRSGQFIGPPAGRVDDFLGTWTLVWQGPIDSGCPCSGTLTVTRNDLGELHGIWKPTKGLPATLSGPVSYDQNVWAGRFEQSDEVDVPMRGHFRIEARGGDLLTGSYQREGTAIPYSWTARR